MSFDVSKLEETKGQALFGKVGFSGSKLEVRSQGGWHHGTGAERAGECG